MANDPCANCGGTSTVRCNHCGGSGLNPNSSLLDDACHGCHGNGLERCPACRGTGEWRRSGNLVAVKTPLAIQGMARE